MITANNTQDLEKAINSYYGCKNTYVLGEEIDDNTFHIINLVSMKHEGKAVFKRKKWYYEE